MIQEFNDLRIWPPYLKQGSYEWRLDEVDSATRALWTPDNPVFEIGKIAAVRGVAHRLRNEPGVLEVDFIIRTPDTPPRIPNTPQVVQIFGRICDHVEGVAEFVGTHPRWRYGVLRLTPQKGIIEPLLLGVRSSCGCDPWLDPRTSRQIYQGACIWLQWRNEGIQ